MSLLVINFDGKILFLDKKAENILGCKLNEVFQKQRIYNFLDYNCIKKFSNFLILSLINRKKDEIQITLNTKHLIKLKIKYYKKDSIVFDVFKYKEKNLIEKSFFFSKINSIIRSKFIIGSVIPLFFSVFWIYYRYKYIDFNLLPLVLINLFFLHAAANTFNDYFDWKSGRDKNNLDYILFSTGGSRALDFKLISEKKLFFLSLFNLLISLIIGIYFVYLKGFLILVIGLTAFFSVYFYSAPPIHLASRYGLGELMHVFCLGPFISFGCVLILTEEQADIADFLVGLPFGLIITSCLLINECPDAKYDRLNKKFNIPAFIGIKYVPYVYIFLIFSAFFFVFFGIFFLNFPKIFYLIIFILPYLYNVLKSVFNIKKHKKFLYISCLKSFYLYINFSLFLIFSLIFCILIS